MTGFVLIVSLGWPVAAYCAYQWWKADMDVDILEQRCEHLVRLLERARDAMRGRVQARPAPRHWGERPYDRIVADMGLNQPPDHPPTLSVVPDAADGREAHSHAERGTTR